MVLVNFKKLMLINGITKVTKKIISKNGVTVASTTESNGEPAKKSMTNNMEVIKRG